MEPLRIAVLSTHTSPLARLGGSKAGGMNVYVLELSRELVKAGCRVDVFSRATSASMPEVIEVEPGLRVIHLRAGPARNLAPEAVYRHIGSFEKALVEFTTRDGGAYDVIHSHYWLSGLVGENLKGTWNLPHVTMFHTLGEIKNRASQSEHEPPIRIQSEALVLRSADRIICATEHEKSLLIDLYEAPADKISVIPLGVDLDRFRPQDKDAARRELGFKDERIVLFVGRIEPLKGVDILIKAAAMLESDIECSVLIVGGDASTALQVAELKNLASDLGIRRRVAFVGAVDHDKLPLFYNAADVCVVPSHYESFGLVAIEAMASGVPVVASRVGGLMGTVKDGETGYLIPWLCPEPFAERIEMLLENESLRRSLGETAREVVSRYRWDHVAAAILEVYHAVTTGHAELLPTGT
jgi:D-inositol-3-phosphate glycosyltransferase